MECRRPNKIKLRSSCSDGGEDVRVSSILDCHDTNSVESAAGSAELDVVTFEMEDLGSAEDCEVLKFGLSDGRAVVGNDHQLGGTVSELLLGELVT